MPLQQYLHETFGTPIETIVVDHSDIPPAYPVDFTQSWRKATRRQCNISEDRYVYVYNGSAKPWQCPVETVAFFHEQYIKNGHSFLLVLHPRCCHIRIVTPAVRTAPFCLSCVYRFARTNLPLSCSSRRRYYFS